MKIYIGSDHQGFQLKEALAAWLKKEGYDVEDVGDKNLNPEDDYPQFAQAAAHKVLVSDAKNPRAILLCGNGQGMAIAANRFKGIRAVVAWDEHEAKTSRIENDSNILSLSARQLDGDITNMKNIIVAWLNTGFSAATRHIRRNQEIDEV
jgi:ribose 5-phosphate isomerase B